MGKKEIIRYGTNFSIYDNPPEWAIPPKDMTYIEDNGLAEWIKINRFYETHIMEIFLKHIEKEPEVILDIGGNIGNHALMFHQLYTKSKVYSFEASPYNFIYLYRNVSEVENIFPFCIGLGNKREVVDFNHYEEDFGSSGVASFQTSKKDEKKPAYKMSILLERFDELGLNILPDLIKIDVENYEINVMKGMGNLLNSMKQNSYIWVEDHALEHNIIEKEGNTFNVENSPSNYLIRNHNFDPVVMVECNVLLKKL